MSFRCEICGLQQPTRAKPFRVVLETFTHQHYNLERDQYGGVVRRQAGEGSQIAKEAVSCRMCAKEHGIEVPEEQLTAPVPA